MSPQAEVGTRDSTGTGRIIDTGYSGRRNILVCGVRVDGFAEHGVNVVRVAVSGDISVPPCTGGA